MEPLRYLDFELALERQGDHYQAQVLRSPGGEAMASFALPFTADRLENLVLKMNPARGRMRGLASDELDAARELGGKLFESVFSGEVLACLRSSLDEVYRQDGVGLRLKLRLQEVGELADLPWEYLFDRALDRFLAQSNYTPVVRYIELPQRIRPLSLALPLRILVMISSPTDPDYPTLDVGSERERLQKALEGLSAAGKVEVDWLEKATLSELQRLLRSKEYHIFHYVGHGGFDQRAQEGVLILEDEQGRGFRAPSYRLGPLLHDHRSLRLAVLNSCEGARNSRDDPFAGMATSLIRQGIPAVVAMQFEITDGAALTFAGDFYTALAEGLPVDAAVAEARKAILVQANDIEWGTPVLYMRAPDGVLFDVNASAVVVPPAPAAPVPPRIEPTPEPITLPPEPIVILPPPIEPAPAPVVMPPPVPEPVRVAPTTSLAAAAMELVARGTARRFRATPYDLVLRNDGDQPIEMELAARDTASACAFDLPASVALAPHSTETIPLRVTPKARRFMGSRLKRAFTVSAAGSGGNEPPLTVSGEYDDLSYGWLPFAGGGIFAIALAAVFLPPLLNSDGPAPSGDSSVERIFFQSNRDGNDEIYAMDEDGSEQRRITFNTTRDILPHLSYYGEVITFTSERDGNQEIYIMAIDGTNQIRLTNNPGQDVEADMSPDYSTVIYERVVGTNYEIYATQGESEPVNLSRSPAGEFDPAWSPGGSEIAFSSDRDGNIEIYVMNADGTNVRRLTRSNGNDFESAWSADGSKIAFQSNRDGNEEIYIMNADGSGQTRLTDNPAEDLDPAWSPDGNQIAFETNRTGNREIFAMGIDGSGLVNLTNNPADDLHPTWAWVTP